MEEAEQEQESNNLHYLEKFILFETPYYFYMVGRNEQKTHWRVLKIGRSDPSKLIIYEDPTIYSYAECKLLLQAIKEANKQEGGLKFVTTCYGIVGFIKFLGPHYMILITERRETGKICGQPVYAVSDYRMIPIPRCAVWSLLDNFERENRYKKLLQVVDMKKDFFFSYSYPVMHSLQKNLSIEETRLSCERAMFVWNEYLTRKIRNQLKNTLWTVALVHGFFKQESLSIDGKTFSLTLIARRSHHFAGTRYHKRGVNAKGQVANDVEIEQIVCPEIHGEVPNKITSAVQTRGSIPLHWFHKPSWWKFKPAILLSEGNSSYEATQIHLQNLDVRYGSPIQILSLVKGQKLETKPRESLLNDEFHNAVNCINKGLPEEDQVKFLHLDLNAVFKAKGTKVMVDLKDIAARALEQIKFFSYQIPESISFKSSYDFSHVWTSSYCVISQEIESCDSSNIKHQEGIQRTNCIDSLDRTNFAQYVYGMVSLGRQLETLQMTGPLELDGHPLAYRLMSMYESMGDSLAHQYGGSAAHSKMFARCRGECKLVTKLWGLMIAIQRHFNNSFMDVHKQKAIDIFLGHSHPEVDGPYAFGTILAQSLMKRSQSDSKIYKQTSSDTEDSSSSPRISSNESDMSMSRSSSTSDIYPRYISLLQEFSVT